jgi:WD40 repeat protein
MNDTQGPHPSLEQLAAFDLGRLRPAEWADVERHVAHCDVCCRRLETLPDDPLLALVRDSAGQPAACDHSCDTFHEPPSRVSTPDGTPVGREVPEPLRDHPRYQVLELLGSGGMGAVFKARHLLMERTVALKVISKDLTDRPAAVERFRLEVRAAARLAHPNIVTAYDAEQAGDVHFLAMEYVDGIGLDRALEQRGPFPVAEACRLMRQVALALQHAHERGMVHRDIKPANLLLTPDGQVKVLDFGLARFVRESAPGGPLTQLGAVVGTPDYMAPEQALQPQQADIRADLYSLGCTLYHLLAGQPPFPESNYLEKLMAHQERRPRLVTAFRDDVPADLARVLDRLLAKGPADRYQTPAEVADDLALFAGDDTPTIAASASRQPEVVRHRRWPWAVAAAALLLLPAVGWLGFLAVSALRERPEEKKARGAGREVRQFEGNTGLVPAVAFSPDGELAAAGGTDKVVRVWEAATGKLRHSLEGNEEDVRALAFSPDGRRLASAGGDRTVRLWKLGEDAPLKVLRGHTDKVVAVAFTPDGKRIASGAYDKTIRVWHLDTGEVQVLRGHNDKVRSVAFTPDGRLLSAADDSRLLLWDLTDPQPRLEFAHPAAAWHVTLSGDGRYAAVACWDKRVYLWDLDRHLPVRNFEGHTQPVFAAVLTRDGRHLLSGGRDRTLRLWDVATGKQLAVYDDHAGEVHGAALTTDGRFALSCGEDKTIRLWKMPEEWACRPVRAPEKVLGGALSADGKALALALGDNVVRVQNVSDGPEGVAVTPRLDLHGHASAVMCVALRPDGKVLASAGRDSTVRLWDTASGKRLATLEGHTDWVWAVAFSPDGKALASAGRDGSVRLWDLERNKERANLTGHDGAVRCVQFSADGKRLASGGEDHTLRLWDAATGKPQGTLNGHTASVYAVAWSPDGKSLASGGADRLVKLWDAETGKERASLNDHAGAVWSVAFTADGKVLATAGAEHIIKLRDSGTGKPLLPLIGHKAAVTCVSFRGDGKQLASVDLDAQVIVWNTDLEHLPEK